MKRKGGYVLFSSYFAKLITFAISVFIIRLLPKEEFGYIAYASTIISFIAPFKGLGMDQGLLRYGSIAGSQQLKKLYFNQTIKKGLLYSILTVILICVITPILSINMKEAFIFILIMSIQIIGLLLIETIKIYTRIIHLNKLYANITIYNNLFLFIGVVSASSLWGAYGYVISLVLIPIFYSVFLLFKLRLFQYNSNQQIVYSTKSFLSYGFYMSLGGMLSQLLYAVDIMLIGNLIKDAEAVAQYKTSNIIPFSLLILPVAILTTDFVHLANKSEENKKAIWHYYLNYLKIMFFISLCILGTFYFFSEEILSIFGKEYSKDNNLMFVFSVGVVGALLLRIPLGNILSAIGWPKINALFSVIVLVINLIAGYYCVLNYGILGAAYTTIALMWFSGILSLFALIYYLRK
ncbi:MAG: oligosaccharide flippase family protein [Flavobacteriales bacterium]|nr:oligosaccharide flippase family protein [Flavobacteriales bacterium]